MPFWKYDSWNTCFNCSASCKKRKYLWEATWLCCYKCYLDLKTSSTLLGLRNIRTGLEFQESFLTLYLISSGLRPGFVTMELQKYTFSQLWHYVCKPFSASRSTMQSSSQLASQPSRTYFNCYKFWPRSFDTSKIRNNKPRAFKPIFYTALFVQIHWLVNIIKYIYKLLLFVPDMVLVWYWHLIIPVS